MIENIPLEYRLQELEDQLATVSMILGWLLLAGGVYLLVKTGMINLEVLHG